MTKALVTSIFNPHPRTGDHWKSMIHAWLRCAEKWADTIDTAYLNLAGADMSPSQFPFKNVILTHMDASHWEVLNAMIPRVTEDAFLILDHDTLIYNKQIVEEGYRRIEPRGHWDICTILDNSGSEDLYPPNQYRGVRRRIAPYLCFIRTKILQEVNNLDFTPIDNKYDSMGYITHQLHDAGARIYELPDDRTTLRLHEDQKIERDTWLDGPGFLWSEPSDAPKTYGYYHVRNAVLGVSLMNEFEMDKQAYYHRKRITPFPEAIRSLAWWWIYDTSHGILSTVHPLSSKVQTLYNAILKDYDISPSLWKKYITEFMNYHAWTKHL